MAWDNSRPIPWERLMREWVIYAAVMGAIFVVFFRNSNLTGALAGVLVSGPMYLVFGAVLAKFGYQRKTMKELRSTKADKADKTDDSSGDDESTTRSKPAPTSRTATGPNRPSGKKRKR